ncbi:MAG: 1-acyl-sn-glycerol-3-phosphate acyltransferase [Bacteroidales bacterium]|jgi:1-acyl-sn-glycerol-3-phosphate acyltransferase|nr:1-acyl-sn-glycerol-3-phosphate acyltransferase [Bacteroidales bacterium]
MRKKTDQKATFYNILHIYATFIFRRWFRTIEINGKENVPEDASVIFAPNHQNALMDAMSLLSSLPKPIVFMARSDLFRKKAIDKILRSLNIIPAYRMREGYGNLKKNENSFEHAIRMLLDKNFFCLMPEGGQEETRTLRPLVKGIFRIAFAAQERLKDAESVKIVPVGIDYGNYDHSGSHLIVNYGKAIDVVEYYDSYSENPAVAQNQLRDELSKRMASLMLNIGTKEYYDCFYIASYLYNSRMLDKMGLEENETNRLAARQQIVALLQKAEDNGSVLLPGLDKCCKKWADNCNDIVLAARTSESGNRTDRNLLISICCLTLTFPLFLYGVLVNGIPYLLTKFFSWKSKGTGFQASLAFGLTVLLFPVFFILETIACFLIVPSFWIVIAFILSLPLSLLLMSRYTWCFRFVRERLKNIFVKNRDTSEILNYVEQLVRD